MRTVECEGPAYEETLDACTLCALFWFDPTELEALPPRASAQELSPAAKRAARAKELSPAAKRAAGIFESEMQAKFARRQW